MTIKLNAQPYDMTAGGFYFSSPSEFIENAMSNKNDQGYPVEEYEIQFIDGDAIDCELAKAWGINQTNFAAFLKAAEEWEQHEKEAFIIAVGECGYDFDPKNVSPGDFGVDIYLVDNMRELAERFVDEGILGDIPKHLENYIDYGAIAYDLSMDYTETEIAGNHIVYRCA